MMNVKTCPHQLYQFCEMLNVKMRPLLPFSCFVLLSKLK
jgi:hypothetical protein